MNTVKLPASVVISLGLHGGALVAFGLLMREAPKQAPRMVEGVDLLIQAPKPRVQAGEAAPKPPPLSTFDFLKLALPTPTHSAAPAELAVKMPEHKIALADAPKLEDHAPKALPKLQALDLGARPAQAQSLDVKIQDRRSAAATLAALPRLEDVGRKRVKNLPQALQLEDQRREAVAAQGLPDVAIKPPSRRQALAAAAALQDAAPVPRPTERIGSVLDKPLLMEAKPQAVTAPKLEKIAAAEPKAERRQAATADVDQKKGIEIEGPLADRPVKSYVVPPFPDWAKNQGILEADVAIRFTVDEDGNVMTGMRVTNSSGYGRLDKLAMESLKNWVFAQKPGAGVQWGVITFRFVLE
jgi:TonB family protein